MICYLRLQISGSFILIFTCVSVGFKIILGVGVTVGVIVTTITGVTVAFTGVVGVVPIGGVSELLLLDEEPRSSVQ